VIPITQTSATGGPEQADRRPRNKLAVALASTFNAAALWIYLRRHDAVRIAVVPAV